MNSFARVGFSCEYVMMTQPRKMESATPLVHSLDWFDAHGSQSIIASGCFAVANDSIFSLISELSQLSRFMLAFMKICRPVLCAPRGFQ